MRGMSTRKHVCLNGHTSCRLKETLEKARRVEEVMSGRRNEKVMSGRKVREGGVCWKLNMEKEDCRMISPSKATKFQTNQ
jgi:hypothetical protein